MATTTKPATSFPMRLIGAVSADPLLYEEVEADRSAIVQPMARVAESLRQQYLIGYSTPNREDGRRHAIRLEGLDRFAFSDPFVKRGQLLQPIWRCND